MNGSNAFYYKLRYFLLPQGMDFDAFIRSLKPDRATSVTELLDKGLAAPYFCSEYSVPVRLFGIRAEEIIPVTVEIIEKAEYDRKSLLSRRTETNSLRAHAAKFLSEFKKLKSGFDQFADGDGIPGILDVTEALPPLLPNGAPTIKLYIGKHEGKYALFASALDVFSPVFDAAVQYVISRLNSVFPENRLFLPYIPKGFPCTSECTESALFYVKRSENAPPVLYVVSDADKHDVALHLFSAIGENSLKAAFSSIFFESASKLCGGEPVSLWQIDLMTAETAVPIHTCINAENTAAAESLGARLGIVRLPKGCESDGALPVPVADAIAFLIEKGYLRALYKLCDEAVEIDLFIADEAGFLSVLNRLRPCFDRFSAEITLL